MQHRHEHIVTEHERELSLLHNRNNYLTQTNDKLHKVLLALESKYSTHIRTLRQELAAVRGTVEVLNQTMGSQMRCSLATVLQVCTIPIEPL